MANGYVIGSGGGSSLEPKGNEGIPIYVNSNDELQECTYINLSLHGTADKAKQLCNNDGTLYDVGENGDTIISFKDGIPVASISNIGNATSPIYIEKGKITASNITVGTASKPVYLNKGTITASDATIGTASKPVYMNDGTIIASDATIGTASKPVYMNDGTIIASDSTIGSTSKPVYMNGGTITQCGDTLANNISGNAASSSKLYVNTTSADTIYYILGATGTGTGIKDIYNAYNSSGNNNKNGIRFNAKTGVLLGAAWNDYAEFRLCDECPGTCVVESKTGKLIRATKRLQKCSYIVSDTYGFIIGPDSSDYKAVAVSGRVLAKTLEQLCIGDVVCSGPNGTVSKMNRLEIILFPDRILGIVSEIPNYTKWNNVEVNNRVWVKVR